MKLDTNYCFKGSEDFVIENGVHKGAESPCIAKYNNYGKYILEHLKASPEFVGQVDGQTGRKETFAEMAERSVKCAMWMKEQNVKIGDIVGVCTYNQMDMIIPCFASLYIGALYNPWWHSGLTSEMVRHFLTLTRCNIAFVDDVSAELVVQVAKEMNIPLKVCVFGNVPGIQSLNDVLASQDSNLVAEFRCTELSSPEESAAMLYTSGSTGMPKGAVCSHKSLYGNARSYMALGKNKGTRVSLTFSPFAWGTSFVNVLGSVVTRATRIVYPEFTEEIALELIEKFKINWILLGTSTATRIQKSPAMQKYDLSSLKYLYISGSVLKEKTQTSLAASFPETSVRQLYGMTEMGATLDQYEEPPKPGSCGKVMKNVMMKVIDTDSGAVVGPNQMGELCFKTTCVLKYYYKNPEATSEIVDTEGWIHTGDLGLYDEEGNVFITDRMKELIKYRLNHIAPAMIEQILQSHPEVHQAAVVGVPHDIDGEHPIAFVARLPNAQVTEEVLEKLVADKLPDYMRLRGGVRFLKELPHTPSGKVSKTILRKMARDNH